MLTSLARASLGGTAGMIEPKKGMFDRMRLAASWHQINGPLFRKYVALFRSIIPAVPPKLPRANEVSI